MESAAMHTETRSTGAIALGRFLSDFGVRQHHDCGTVAIPFACNAGVDVFVGRARVVQALCEDEGVNEMGDWDRGIRPLDYAAGKCDARPDK